MKPVSDFLCFILSFRGGHINQGDEVSTGSCTVMFDASVDAAAFCSVMANVPSGVISVENGRMPEKKEMGT